MLQLKLGVSPINWINDDVDDIGDFYQLEDVLRDMQALGFVGTEMGRKYPKHSRELLPLLEQHGLRLSGAWKTVQFSSGWNPEQDFAEFANHVSFLRDMQAEVVVVCDGGGSLHWDARGQRTIIEKFDGQAWQRLAHGLNRAGEYALAQGLGLVYHPHFGTGVETPAEIDRLMAETNPAYVSLLADTGHIFVCGGNPVAVIKKHIERIPYLHLKDVRQAVLAQVKAHGTLFIDAIRQGMFTTPGDGCIDFPGVFEVLADHDYQGWAILEAEQDPLMADPVQHARASKAYLKSLIARATTTPSDRQVTTPPHHDTAGGQLK